MLTYQNLCVAHARRIDDVLSDEYYLSNKTLKIWGIMKEKPSIAYQIYVVDDFMTGCIVLRLDEDDLWFVL